MEQNWFMLTCEHQLLWGRSIRCNLWNGAAVFSAVSQQWTTKSGQKRMPLLLHGCTPQNSTGRNNSLYDKRVIPIEKRVLCLKAFAHFVLDNWCVCRVTSHTCSRDVSQQTVRNHNHKNCEQVRFCFSGEGDVSTGTINAFTSVFVSLLFMLDKASQSHDECSENTIAFSVPESPHAASIFWNITPRGNIVHSLEWDVLRSHDLGKSSWICVNLLQRIIVRKRSALQTLHLWLFFLLMAFRPIYHVGKLAGKTFPFLNDFIYWSVLLSEGHKGSSKKDFFLWTTLCTWRKTKSHGSFFREVMLSFSSCSKSV